MGKLEYYTTLPLMPAFAPGRGEQAVPAEFMDTHALRPGIFPSCKPGTVPRTKCESVPEIALAIKR